MPELPTTGELSKQITLYTLTTTYDAENQPVYTPTVGPTVYAKMMAERSETIEVNGQKTLRVTWSIVVRYRDPFLFKSCTYKGRTIRFEGEPIDMDEARQFLTLSGIEDADRG